MVQIGRAITAVARASCAISLNGILPMWVQNNSTKWFPDRFTIHLEVMEVIKLFVFTSAPLFPCAQGTKLPSSKAANGLLSWSSLRLDGLYDHFHFFGGE